MGRWLGGWVVGLVGEGGGGGAELVIEKGCVADSQLRLYRKQTIEAS